MESLKLPIDFVDNYILKTSPDYALVYIYAYRHREDEDLSPKSISAALGMNVSRVENAISYWTAEGYDIFRQKKLPPVGEKSRYSAGEISKFAENDSELAALYQEIESVMEKPLSSNDLQTLFWIYHDLGMSSSMILLMATYAKRVGKCRVKFIEKTAMEWSEQGIDDFQSADNKVKELEQIIDYEERIKKLFGIERNLIASEKTILSDWLHNIKPTKDRLLKAYEICVERTGKFSAKYINAILVNWQEESKAGSSKNPNPQKTTKFNNFTPRTDIDYKKLEMDALKKRLAKNRGEQDDD